MKRKYATAEQYLADWPFGVSGGKGTGTSKDQLNLMNQYLKQATDNQNAMQNAVKGALDKYMTGAGVGFDPAQFSALTSQFMNQNTSDFNSAAANVRSSMQAAGMGTGALPAGGDFVRGLEGIESARASSQSQGILGLNIQNLQQALANKFNAAGIESGLSAQQGANIGTFTGGAGNALNNYVQASNTGFGNAFTTALGGSLGKGIGSLATFGVGSGIGDLGKMLGSNYLGGFGKPGATT